MHNGPHRAHRSQGIAQSNSDQIRHSIQPSSGVGQPLSVPVGCSQRSRPQPDKVPSHGRNLPTFSFGPSGLLTAPPTFHGRGSSHCAEHDQSGTASSYPAELANLSRSQWAARSAPDHNRTRYPVKNGTCPLSLSVLGCSQRPRPSTAEVPVTVRNTTTPAGPSGLLSALLTRHRQGIQSPTATSSLIHFRSKSFRDTPPIEWAWWQRFGPW